MPHTHVLLNACQNECLSLEVGVYIKKYLYPHYMLQSRRKYCARHILRYVIVNQGAQLSASIYKIGLEINDPVDEIKECCVFLDHYEQRTAHFTLGCVNSNYKRLILICNTHSCEIQAFVTCAQSPLQGCVKCAQSHAPGCVKCADSCPGVCEVCRLISRGA